MNEVANVNGVYRLANYLHPQAARSTAPPRPEMQEFFDEVEISDMGALLSRVRDLPDLRLDKIARLRAEIADGTFETAERLDGTVDRLLEELQS